MLAAQPTHRESGDAFGVQPLDLLGDLPHRLELPQCRRPRDQIEERLSSEPPHRPLRLGPEHTQPPLILGIVGDQQQRYGATAPAPLPSGSHPALVHRRHMRILDAVDEPARGDPIRRARVAASRKRSKASKKLLGVHKAKLWSSAIPPG